MFSKKFLILGIVGAIALTGCTPKTQEATTPSEDDAMMEKEGDAMMEGEQGDAMMEKEGDAMMEGEMVVDASNFKYLVDTITASPGDTLTIKLTNSQGTHDFVIDELDVQSDTIQAGEETTVTVEIPADATPGTEYAFYCSIGNHREMGMEGTLVIK